MTIGEYGAFTDIETRTFRHFIQRIFRDRDQVCNPKYFNILRF